MKTLKIVLLTLIISFLVYVTGLFIVFKYIITPERIRYYLDVYIEKSVNEKLSKSDSEVIDKIYSSNYRNYRKNSNNIGDEFENLNRLEKHTDIKQLKDPKLLEKLTEVTETGDIKALENISDINYLSSKLFGDINLKMDLLKYKINEYFSKKNIKEE